MSLYHIDKLKFFAQEVLPSVYDESLSYYEVLNKISYKLNEAIDSVNNQNDVIDDFIHTLVSEYNANKSYSTGEYCQYDDNIYKCVSDTTGNWDATKWTEVVFVDSVGDDIILFKEYVNDIITNFNNLITSIISHIATPYDSTNEYEVGDYVSYNGVIYKCVTNTSGEFDAEDWESVVVTNELFNYVDSLWDDFIDNYIQTLGIDDTLTQANEAAESKTVGDILYGSSTHTGKTPIVINHFDTYSYTTENKFDIRNMPANSFIFNYANIISNAFEEGGIFSDCPITYSPTSILRIEKKQLRTSAQAFLYTIVSIDNEIKCWRSSGDNPTNYWIGGRDTTLNKSKMYPDSKVVGNFIYNSSDHSYRTPTITNYYDISSFITGDNKFNIANLPQDTFLFQYTSKISNLFENGGMFEDCPSPAGNNEIIYIHRKSLRPDLGASIYVFTTIKKQMTCWRNTSGNNYWIDNDESFGYITDNTHPNGYSLDTDMQLNESVFVRGDLIGQIAVDEFTGNPAESNTKYLFNNIPYRGVSVKIKDSDATIDSAIAITKTYDTTKNYAVGNYTIYNRCVYICISSTTGTFDATAWKKLIAYDGQMPREQYYFITKYGLTVGQNNFIYWTACSAQNNGVWIGYKTISDTHIRWMQINNPIQNLKVAMLGDSVTYGTSSSAVAGGGAYSFRGYPYWVSKICGNKFDISYKDIAFSGMGWLKDGHSAIRDEDYPNAKANVARINWNNYDVLTICLGFNDANAGFSIGTENDNTSDNTVGGAINYVLDYVYNNATNGNKKLKVVLMTIPRNLSTGDKASDCSEINTLITNIANKYGIPIIDMSKWTNTFNLDYLLADTIHPTANGYKVMGEYVAGQLQSIIG